MRFLTATLLSFVVLGLTGSGCATGDTNITTGTGPSAIRDASADVFAGSCNPQFCPGSGAGTACCVTANGPCGINYGRGCVLRRDGG